MPRRDQLLQVALKCQWLCRLMKVRPKNKALEKKSIDRWIEIWHFARHHFYNNPPQGRGTSTPRLRSRLARTTGRASAKSTICVSALSLNCLEKNNRRDAGSRFWPLLYPEVMLPCHVKSVDWIHQSTALIIYCIPTCACALILTVSLPNGDYIISINPPRGSSNLDARAGQTQSSFGASCAASCQQVVFVHEGRGSLLLRDLSAVQPFSSTHSSLNGAFVWGLHMSHEPGVRSEMHYWEIQVVPNSLCWDYSHWSLINRSRVTVLKGLMTAIINHDSWPCWIDHDASCTGTFVAGNDMKSWSDMTVWHLQRLQDALFLWSLFPEISWTITSRESPNILNGYLPVRAHQ